MAHPLEFDVAYPDRNLNRLTSALRIFTVIPIAMMDDRYPSTDEQQSVRLEVPYPDATRLNRWLPLVKWLLAIPHYIALIFLYIGAFFALIGAWFAVLFTGRYPRGIFDYLVGVGRWTNRVTAYAFIMLTDDYPPFQLRP